MRLPPAFEQPKLEARWRRGLCRGRTTDSDEHIVGMADGVSSSRTVKILEDITGVDMLVKAMTWAPVFQRPVTEARQQPQRSGPVEPQAPEGPVGPPARQPKRPWEIGEAPACRRLAARELRAFHAACGRMEGCSACMYGADGRSHSTTCRARRLRWLGAGQPEAMDETEDNPQVKRGREEDPEAGGSQPMQEEKPSESRETKEG